MRVFSLIYDNYEHQLIEVEVSLQPGLPGIQILGLPDPVVKDCVWRIKSAFTNLGFEWPTSSQVVVNLKPTHVRKKGSGLDLAISAAILWETGQMEPMSPSPLLYGEVDLMGEVHAPFDLIYYTHTEETTLVTGRLTESIGYPYHHVSTLRDLKNPTLMGAVTCETLIERPRVMDLQVQNSLAEVILTASVGEHPILLAGSAGTGKSTAAQAIHSLLEEPDRKTLREIRKFHHHLDLKWRPLRAPHHTTSSLAIIGGGPSARPGELTKAHGGTLLLDEFLEFDIGVQESLREPLEKGEIELVRSTTSRRLPARFMLIATTNLCRCGEFEPGLVMKCHCGEVRRRKYLERISGPILDRFAIVCFSNHWVKQEKTVPLLDLLKRAESAYEFRRKRGQWVANQYAPLEELKLSQASERFLCGEKWSSERRRQSLLRIARTLADLDLSEEIHLQHLETARHLAVINHVKLKGISFERSFGPIPGYTAP